MISLKKNYFCGSLEIEKLFISKFTYQEKKRNFGQVYSIVNFEKFLENKHVLKVFSEYVYKKIFLEIVIEKNFNMQFHTIKNLKKGN